MAPREKWSDERLDDLNEKVDKGFADTKDVIAETKAEMREGFARVDTDLRELRGEMNAGFDKINARFESLYKVLIGGAGAIIVALIGLIGTLIGINAL